MSVRQTFCLPSLHRPYSCLFVSVSVSYWSGTYRYNFWHTVQRISAAEWRPLKLIEHKRRHIWHSQLGAGVRSLLTKFIALKPLSHFVSLSGWEHLNYSQHWVSSVCIWRDTLRPMLCCRRIHRNTLACIEYLHALDFFMIMQIQIEFQQAMSLSNNLNYLFDKLHFTRIDSGGYIMSLRLLRNCRWLIAISLNHLLETNWRTLLCLPALGLVIVSRVFVPGYSFITRNLSRRRWIIL